jgi:hypothetical protein
VECLKFTKLKVIGPTERSVLGVETHGTDQVVVFLKTRNVFVCKKKGHIAKVCASKKKPMNKVDLVRVVTDAECAVVAGGSGVSESGEHKDDNSFLIYIQETYTESLP